MGLIGLILRGNPIINELMKYLVLILPFLMIASPAHATRTVMSPYVAEGVGYVESKSGYTMDEDNNVDGAWAEVFGFGYGITDYWATEVEVGFGQSGARNADVETRSVEWQHKFQFAPKDEWPVDLGGRVSYVYNTNTGPDRINGILAVGKTIESVDLLGNAFVTRQVGEDSNDETSYGLFWSASYKYSDSFKPGVEIYSDFGGGIDTQHQIGPVAYGKVFDNVGYNAGVLFGLNDDTPDATLKLILDYKFSF